jgi:hypothetical protein
VVLIIAQVGGIVIFLAIIGGNDEAVWLDSTDLVNKNFYANGFISAKK